MRPGPPAQTPSRTTDRTATLASSRPPITTGDKQWRGRREGQILIRSDQLSFEGVDPVSQCIDDPLGVPQLVGVLVGVVAGVGR